MRRQRLALTNDHAYNGTPAALLLLRKNRTACIAYAARHLSGKPRDSLSLGAFFASVQRQWGRYASLRAASRQAERGEHARVLPGNLEIVEVLLGASANSRRISAG